MHMHPDAAAAAGSSRSAAPARTRRRPAPRTRRRPGWRAALAVVLAVAAVAACGTGDDASDAGTDTAQPSPTVPGAGGGSPTAPAPAPSPEPTPTDEEDDQPFEGTTGSSSEEADGFGLSPVDLRFAERPGFDRVVLDLVGDGDAQPGWDAEYTDDPRFDGRGDQVDIEGDPVLLVSVSGIQLPTEEGAREFEGSDRLTPSSSGIVAEVVRGTLFEGRQQVFVGVASEQPYRVFRLSDPTRLVIDVRHP